MSTPQDDDLPPSERLDRLLLSENRIQEVTTEEAEAEADEGDYETEESAEEEQNNPYDVHGWMGKLKITPALYSTLPILKDDLETETSVKQDAVAELCRQLMSGEEREIHDLNSHGIPKLQRQKHINFMHKSLGTYPPAYQAMDASRPWILYWALAGLAHMGEDVSIYRDRCMQTFTPLQNKDGGFGGGHGQTSHGAATYAATLSLALVEGLELIDRRSMWQWLGSLKQPPGGFAMAVDGEVDVRGAYCSMVVVSLLNLPLELPPDAPARKAGLTSFLDRLGEWVGRCQTFEGGIGGAPDNEAHGAYAFCGLACLSIIGAPHRSIPQNLNVDRLVHWLVSRQPAPEGGFSGRTNKLVDACYSHWVGGCWALLEAAIYGPGDNDSRKTLWNREALVRYTLCCSQTKQGGLRDKPGTRQDGYHTNYSLAGLSAAQNHWRYHERLVSETEDMTNLPTPFQWRGHLATEEERDWWAFDKEDLVGLVHPIFVMPPQVVDRCKTQFSGIVGF
ncbi:terpenoid cyclases/protein prenyltransferase alpha-alpha toroid [Elsinoe ampelina]|uniref:Protein farnesyltransferase subunit beta n=1 Tax=Elsinoe ampelina TaxID=302913 RepID=A0A6A6GGQ1_9PEZI|nr:terpenoid cyclases/protein prenyltransferase alpha-alpha toroid [Elsinoe ampelina]